MGGSKSKDGLGDREKWGLLDVEQFGRLLLRYEADLVTLQDVAEKHQPMLREIQSNMLKGEQYSRPTQQMLMTFSQLKQDGKRSHVSIRQRTTTNLRKCCEQEHWARNIAKHRCICAKLSEYVHSNCIPKASLSEISTRSLATVSKKWKCICKKIKRSWLSQHHLNRASSKY